ncbi:MAG TPA: AraC family transcriptional regulator [Caulobacteraceae bacterium]|jgi:AraC-like DNA-binding protein
MNDLALALRRYTDSQAGVSPFVTAVPGMGVLRSDHPKPPAHMLSRPSLCIVAQGAKWATFGETELEYRAGQALLVGVDTPSIGRVVQASADEPCLVLVLALDLALLQSVAATLTPPPALAGSEATRGFLVTDFQGPLSDCALRLVRLLQTPQAIPALYPGVMREICYWLLTGPHAAEVASLSLASGAQKRIGAAVQTVRDHFRLPVRIEALADIAHLSISAFHRQFKALTGQTPLQYQKRLRLLEARRLMVSEAMSVEAAAFDVGYQSASQFSREYARMFGAPPKRDVASLRAAPQSPAIDEDVLRAAA